MRPDVVLFDLDGTLTESAPGITRSIAFALDAIGMPPVDDATLLRFIGPPLRESFRTIIGLDDETAAQAVAAFRHRFVNDGGMFENSVYPGVSDLLEDLRDAGRTLAVATAKPRPTAVAILEHFALAKYFDVVCGAINDTERATKAHIVADALRALRISAGPRAVMVGDRSHDVVGAHTVGIACIGVGWGYGSRAELSRAGADVIVAGVDGLASALGVMVE
jgi:phosphoglycolate phosphatase